MRSRVVIAAAAGLGIVGSILTLAPPAAAAGSVTVTTIDGAEAKISVYSDPSLQDGSNCVDISVSVLFVLPRGVYTGLVTLRGQTPSSSSMRTFGTVSYYNSGSGTGIETKRSTVLACEPGVYNIFGEFTAGRAPSVTSASILVRVAAPVPKAPPPSGQHAPVVFGTDRAFQVSWLPPEVSAEYVTRYVVTQAETGAVLCETDAATRTCDITLNDGRYQLIVTAFTASGVSAASEPSTVFTVGPPSSPVITSAKVKGNFAFLEWDLPVVDDNRAQPLGFTVIRSDGKQVCSKPGFGDLNGKCKVALLPGRKPTRFRVVALSNVGNSTSDPSRVLRRQP